jgi:hypothetical protein
MVGVSRQTQGNYESGRTPIDLAYLAAFAEAGGDWVYVVLGIKAGSGLRPDKRRDVLRKILWWSEEFCRDQRGKPIPAGERIGFVLDAYELLLGAKDRSSDAEILLDLFKRLEPAGGR